MTKQKILIHDRASNKPVAAVFHEDVTSEQLEEAEAQWKPFRVKAAEQLLSAGKNLQEVFGFIQHVHWEWCRKAQILRDGLLTIRCFGIEKEGQWQGLAMVDLAAHHAMLGPDKGKPLVYVEFLESAPWNLWEMCDPPRFGMIGYRLVEAAVRLSLHEEFQGRVGLLALPQAEPFYQKCNMVCVEGVVKSGMKYFELSRRNAAAFLGEGK